VPKYGWPEVPLEQFYDVQALALSLALPIHLGACGDALGLDIQKDKSGKRLINKLSKPRRATKYNPITRWPYEDAMQDYLEMFMYCKQDVRSEAAIYNALPIDDLPGYERELWLMTVRINDKGVPIDIDTVRNLHHILGQYETAQVRRLAEITDDTVTTAGQIARMKTWIKENHDINIPNMTADTVAQYLKDPDIPDPVKDVLSIRRMMSRTSTKKFNRIIDMVDEDGYVHDIIRYHIATTGRWGGSGLQVHNLPNASVDDPDLVAKIVRQRSLKLFMLFYDDPMYVGSAMIRPIVRAKLGFKLYVSDFNSIENRFTCWLAGDEEALALFRQQIDQYIWFATKLYNIPYNDVSAFQRKHAKTCILGLGYGMGVDKFFETCLTYGFDITYDECKRSVLLYRDIFYKIVRLWYKSYEYAMDTVLTGKTTEYIHLKFIKEDNFLFMQLPSGRRIAYYDPRVEPVETPWGEVKQGITFMGHQPYTRKWTRIKLIPGRLIENASQGGCRDVMAEAKLRVIEKGYNVIFSVHDEVVSHDPVDFGSAAEYTRILCDTNANYYPGLPIDAETFVTNRYRKG
jgi:DNA polymerase